MRTLPYSEDAERGLLGAVLVDHQRVLDMMIDRGLHPSAFHIRPHQIIADAALSLHGAGRVVDSLTITDALRDQGKLDAIGGTTYLDDLVDACPTAAHAAHYADTVAEKHRARCLIQAAQEAVDATYAAGTASAALESLQTRIGSLGEQRRAEPTNAELAGRLLDEWARPINQRKGIMWAIDMMANHIPPITDEYIVLAARPGIGKTSLSLQLCIRAGQVGTTTSFRSLEMPRLKLIRRALGQLTGIDLKRMERNEVSDMDRARIAECVERLRTLPVRITDAPATPEQLVAWGRSEASAGSRLLVVDNLKHVRLADQGKMEQHDRFANVSMAMKRLRDDTGLPVLALHHLNRDMDLACSDSIERDADVVIRMSRNEARSIEPSEENHWVGRDVVDITVAKNRDGAFAGAVFQVEFHKACQTFGRTS